jgi:hypothetical protein
MSVLVAQDQQFINDVRTAASKLLQVANMGVIANTEYADFFGIEPHLGESSFVGDDEGLTKEQIFFPKQVLTSLNTWLDSESRRENLMAVMKQNMSII